MLLRRAGRCGIGRSASGLREAFGERSHIGLVGKRAIRVSGPNEADPLLGVAAVSASRAWAVGCSKCDSGLDQAQLLVWNGKGWTRAPGPAPAEGLFRSSVAATSATSATNAWA
ncbi:MAG: hypothetical protein ACRDOD_25660, partial [Streptosporangiaceae bacterium]